jgi:hypothetical protein
LPAQKIKSPAGTIEGRVSAVPAGLDVLPTGPGIEMPAIFDGSFGTANWIQIQMQP